MIGIAPALGLAADVSSANAPVTSAASSTPATESGEAPRNQIFLELLGNGLLYSLDYERFVPLGGPSSLGLRAGASFITYKISSSVGAGNLVLASLPIVASYYWGPERSPHRLQLGLGVSALYVSASTDSIGQKFSGSEEGLGFAATAVIGYRYVPRHSGVTFGIGFTPLLRSGRGFLPWGGVSGGFAF